MGNNVPGLSPAEQPRYGWLRRMSMFLWAAIMAVQGVSVALSPSSLNVFVAAAFVLLFLTVNAQLLLMRWMGERNWNRLMSRVYRSSYLSDAHNLPNRNYLLAELRREMPRARSTGVPFSLVMVSLDTLDEIKQRRGEAFALRSAVALADVLRRITRNADFIAHLEAAQFCVMLNETAAEQTSLYLRTVPNTIAVSDGHMMYEVPVSTRTVQYDMESLYATDVLRDVEEAPPLRDEVEPRFGSEAA